MLDNKIKISISMLKELKKITRNKSDIVEIDSILQAVLDFVEENDEKELNEKESLPIIIDALEFCLPYFEKAYKKQEEGEREYTLEELSSILMEKYACNSEEMYSTNINKWISDNNIIVVDDKKENKK